MYFKLLIIVFSFGFISCNNNVPNSKSTIEKCSNLNEYISIDSANKMISSYLNSIHYQNNDTDVRAFIMDANALRCYLNSDEGKNVSNLKIFLAHKLDYANSSDSNKNCGYKVQGLTLIVTGFDSLGNYIIYPNGLCIDHMDEIPRVLINGNASNNLIVE